MHIFNQFEPLNSTKEPISLTLGNFDGVHKGHAVILKHLRKVVGPKGRTCVVTFRNHPSQILKPTQSLPLLCTAEHKKKLFKQFEIDYLYIIPFTATMADQSAEIFIRNLHSFIPFSHLILGYDARFGKNREGDPLAVQRMAKEINFGAEYIDAHAHGNKAISSTSIRHAIQSGNLEEAEILLGRPYSIYSQVNKGIGKGREIGFPTANIEVSHLCLPPCGVYAVSLVSNHQTYLAVANLGFAPTIKSLHQPILEVHVLSSNPDLYGQTVEVIFHQFIRAEQKFDSINALTRQIQLDVKKTYEYFGHAKF